ncbi:MFS transporter [Aureimonas sp. OT7]|uniref:MFS transporter n=1 Tax=Aureimonas sp. OT7 TaxID=2816454 RepID=UPI001786B746|nr:MFS transporter [Aureimonas sp. OT7]QOG06374.1 MFS transporter [Aureimonas sp. OT7]
MSSTSQTCEAAGDQPTPSTQHAVPPDRLPLANLLALAVATFITVLTEALPAGILPLISSDLAISEALAGQLVTVYAIGTLLTAIPLTAATQGFRRRPLLVIAIGGFAVVNLVTAFSTSYALTLGARFVAGMFAGLLWALAAGYAVRMVPEHLKGRSMTIAMLGVPLALSIGIPAFTFLASLTGWRVVFGLMSLLAVVLLFWVFLRLPDFPGQTGERRLSLASVVRIPGIRSVLFATFAFVLAHNILYTYIAPFLTVSGLHERVDLILLVFGVVALASIWVIGVLIDRWLRELVLGSTLLFIAAALILGLQGTNATAVIMGVVIWGLAWGGAATLFQTASAKAAGEAADVAQSMIVTVWNLAMAGGGIVGGVLLESAGVSAFPWTLIALLVFAFVVVASARQHGFPVRVQR